MLSRSQPLFEGPGEPTPQWPLLPVSDPPAADRTDGTGARRGRLVSSCVLHGLPCPPPPKLFRALEARILSRNLTIAPRLSCAFSISVTVIRFRFLPRTFAPVLMIDCESEAEQFDRNFRSSHELAHQKYGHDASREECDCYDHEDDRGCGRPHTALAQIAKDDRMAPTPIQQ